MTRILIVVLGVIMLGIPSMSDARPVLFPGGLTALPGSGGFGTNLIQNSGFEAGSGATPDGWTMPAGWARDTTSAHGGTYRYRRTSGGGSPAQTVTLAPGIYRLSGWMNWSNIGGANANVRACALCWCPWYHPQGIANVCRSCHHRAGP